MFIPPYGAFADTTPSHWIVAGAILACGLLLLGWLYPGHSEEELMAKATAAREQQVQWCLSRSGTAQTDAYNQYRGCAIPPVVKP